MENNWENFEQKKTKELKEELQIFMGKLEKIRSNRISLEVVEREINLKLNGEKKSSKTVANLSISSNYELVISNFEPKESSLITGVISRLGYERVGEKCSKDKLYFVLSIMTKEKRDEYVREVKKITEAGRASFRRIRENFRNLVKKEKSFSQDQKRNYEKQIDNLTKKYEDELLEAEKKKIKELSS